MRPHRRFGLLALLGVVIGGGALAYIRHLERADLAVLAAASVPRRKPTGPPGQVALAYMWRAARAGWADAPVPSDAATLANALPSRDRFDQAVAQAAAACDPPVPSATWAEGIEVFGGLPGIFAGLVLEGPPEPLHVASAFRAGIGLTGDEVLLALEPAACHPRRIRSGITYAGHILELPADDPPAQQFLERSRVLAQHARAFRRGDVAVLQGLVDHADPFVRREVVFALTGSGRRKARPHVRRLLEDADPLVRYLAALGAAELGDPAAEPYLREYLGNDWDYLDYGLPHYRAVLALGRLGATDMRGELELMAAWDTPDLFPREARAALKKLGRRGS